MTSCVSIKVDIYWYLCILILKINLKILLKSFLSSEFMEMTWTSLHADKRRVFFRFAAISSNTFHYRVLGPHFFSNVSNWKLLFFFKGILLLVYFDRCEATSFFLGREQPVHQPHNGNSLLWLSVSSLNKNMNLKLLFRVNVKKE